MLQHLWLKARRKHKDQIDLIPYNDCFYRNIYRYEYIGLLDIDEEQAFTNCEATLIRIVILITTSFMTYVNLYCFFKF